MKKHGVPNISECIRPLIKCFRLSTEFENGRADCGVLPERFLRPLLGDEDGENDEDSIINDLEFFLDNYETDWGSGKSTTAPDHWGWEHLKKVVWTKRNSARLRDAVEQDLAANQIELTVHLPAETTEESASWLVKAVMLCLE